MRPRDLRALPLALALFAACGGEADTGPGSVLVQRGSVVREAVAVGRVEAEFEVPVTTPNSGVVTRKFVKLGERVKRDAPLIEVRPVLSDEQRLAAERALVAAREAEATAGEIEAGENLAGQLLRMVQGGRILERTRRGAERARESAETRLELLLEGAVEVDGYLIDYIVRSPIDGHVVRLDLAEGAPVVPASSFGTGTVLMVLADLDRPVFRGTVDEIDVGRLEVGSPARITLGALPGRELVGKLTEISLLADRRDNSSVFPIKLTVELPEDLVLRSGYSAVARIVLERADDVLTLPERVVEFRDDGAFVRLADGGGEPVERRIEVGVSDGLVIEVRAGLSEGERVLERAL